MRVLVGDETGLLKSIELEKNEQRVISSRKEAQSRSRGIQRMCWYKDENQSVNCRENIVIGRANDIVECYSGAHATSSIGREPDWSYSTSTATHEISATRKCVGIDMIERFGSLVHCTNTGDVLIKNTLKECGKPSHFSVGTAANVERMRLEPSQQTHIALGGNERDLQIWSLETQQSIFKGKNVTHDSLDMRVPVWVKDLAFLTPSTSSSGHRVIVGTGYQHLRVYDTATKRRPIQQIQLKSEYPVNTLCVSPDERRVIVADTTGCVDIYDVRTLQHMGRCTGPNGAIRDMVCHPTLPYLAAVGLDRFVHVFDLESRQYYSSIYAKQRLNSVLFTNDGKEAFVDKEDETSRANKRRRGEAPVEEDYDDDEEEEEAYEGLEISDEEVDDEEEEDEEDNEEDRSDSD